MTLTKAYIVSFDGYEGIAVDYLDNQIEFTSAQLSPSCREYLDKGNEVLIEDDGYSIYITSPEDSFNQYEEDQRELQDAVTSSFGVGND